MHAEGGRSSWQEQLSGYMQRVEHAHGSNGATCSSGVEAKVCIKSHQPVNSS